MPERNPLLIAGLLMFGAIALVGLTAPWLAPYDPAEQLDPVAGQLRPPGTRMAAIRLDHYWRLADRVERTAIGLRLEVAGRSEELAAADVLNLTADGVSDQRTFWLGTDRFSRDVLSRLIYGARISLWISVLSLALAMTLGLAVGTIAGLSKDWIDGLLMRSVDGLLTFPWFFLLIALLAFFPSGPSTLILILGGTTWMGISRLVRAEVMSLRERDFVTAARGLGAGSGYLFFRHLLPNILPPLLVSASIRVGDLILTEAGLSFLGFGVAPPAATWGNMIADGRVLLGSAWWVATIPGLALALTVIAVNLVGDGLRDLLDPRHARPA